MITLYLAATKGGRAFAKRLLRERHGVTAPIRESEHGKPYLEGDPLFFNLSHSGGRLAVAVSDREVGVDLQQRTAVPPAIFRRLSAEERQEDFFALWTAKEAFVKFRGGTLAQYLPRLSYEKGALFFGGAPVNVFLKHFDFEDFALCVCSEIEQEIQIVWL